MFKSPQIRNLELQLRHSGGVCPQIQGRQRDAFVGAFEEMMSGVCVGVLQRGHVMDVIWRRLCVSMFEKGFLLF